jgi:hypothetical protein
MDKNNADAAHFSADAEGPAWVAEAIKLADVIQHQELQVRRRLDPGAVKRYADWTRDGREPPPIKVGRVDGRLYLVDGWHRVRAGALVHASGLDDDGRVMALVAEMSERELRWQAAIANMGHGVPLRAAEYREVFRAFIKAGKHKLGRGKVMSYREMATEVGKGHTTVREWMRRDFPGLYRSIGGHDNGNRGAESPKGEVVTLAEEHWAAALAAAEALRQHVPGLDSPQARWEVLQALEGILAEVKRLGVQEPPRPEF